MITLTPEDSTALAQTVTHWTLCWRFEDKQGRVYRQTSLDRDVEVSRGIVAGVDLDGTYSSITAIQSTTMRQSADLAVDNLDIDALLDEFGITADAVRAGIFDGVQYLIFLVNWENPENSGIIVKSGVIGNIKSFAREIATMELRGLAQYLQQNILEQTSLTCRAELGDSKCGIDLSDYTVTGIVDTVTNRRVFDAILDVGSIETPGWFVGGRLTFTSGENDGFTMRVKVDSFTDSSGDLEMLGHFELYDTFPGDIEPGDTFTVTAGCNKQHSVAADGAVTGDCVNKFDNLLNFRGEPFIPGQYAIYSGS